MALSHPLENPDEPIDEEEAAKSAPDIIQDIHQDTEEKGPETVPQGLPGGKVGQSTALNPTQNYRLSARFERSFIDLGRLMVEEGFDLSTYTQVQDLLSEDWKLV